MDTMTPIHAVVKAGELNIAPADAQVSMTTGPNDWMMFGYDTPVQEALYDFIDLYQHNPRFIMVGDLGYLLGPIQKDGDN